MKITNEWISGFVDGNGSFSVIAPHGKEKGFLKHCFIVSQDQKSIGILYALKKSFGCGTVHKVGGTRMNFEISKQEHLIEKVIPFFYAYPLRTQKQNNFKKFHNSLCAYLKEKGKENWSNRCTKIVTSANTPINSGWFRGFVDADGCFSVSIVNNKVMPRFLLGMAEEESALIKECQHFLGCGTLHKRKDGLETLQVSNVVDIETKLIPHFETRGSAVLLRTIKRIAFQKFRKIVRIIHEKKHSTPEGMEKIRKLQGELNKFNLQQFPLISSQNTIIS